MLFLEHGEFTRPRRTRPDLSIAKTFPCPAQRRALRGAGRLEIDARCRSVRLESPALVVGELAVQVLDGIDIDVYGLQRARAGCGIGAVLARRYLAERQQLPQRRAALAKPARHPSSVGVTAQPGTRAADAGQRQQQTSAPAEIEA